MTSYVQKKVCQLLTSIAYVPRHVAFIMDGNRRFARSNNLAVHQGHRMGYEKLAQILEWCSNVGVTTVTVYAFSRDNFKRSSTEVDNLMSLAREKFLEMLQKGDVVEKHQCRVEVLGDLSLLPPEVQHAAAQVMLQSRKYTKLRLNICMAYSSAYEMKQAASALNDAVSAGNIQPEDVTEESFERCLHTNDSPPVDLLLRTSGETRLSDFLLWQAGDSQVQFVPVMWPELSFSHFCWMLWTYHNSHADLVAQRQRALERRKRRQFLLDILAVAQNGSTDYPIVVDTKCVEHAMAKSSLPVELRSCQGLSWKQPNHTHPAEPSMTPASLCSSQSCECESREWTVADMESRLPPRWKDELDNMRRGRCARLTQYFTQRQANTMKQLRHMAKS